VERFFAIVLVVVLGTFCFDYNLDTYFGKDIHWTGDCVAGTITSVVTIPAAVVGFVLVSCDMQKPLCGGD
jgi:hypothetical protein